MRRLKWLLALVCAGAVLAAGENPPPKTLRVYFVGNSVTDTVKYGLLADLAKARGHTMPWGRHMIPGAPLFFMLHNALDGKASGFVEKPYGNCVEALKNHEWDAISLQPFDRRLVDDNKDPNKRPEGDIAVVQQFIDLALAKSPDVQMYLYARWPRCYVNGKGVSYDKEAFDKNVRGVSPVAGEKAPDKVVLDDFSVAWSTPYKKGWGMQLESKDYFEQLLQAVRQANPAMKKPVLMIPVGYVMAELNDMMKAGKVPGFKDIHDVYADGIHLNNVGSYITACTFYATLFKEDPAGLPSGGYQVNDAALAKLIHETVWRVVKGQPYSGVK